MSKSVAIEMIGDWNAQVGAALKNALYVSMELCGRNGYEACKHAMILMVKSARKLTKTAKNKRPIQHDFSAGRDLPFIEVFNQGKPPILVYKFEFSKKAKREGKAELMGTFDDWRKIHNAGLAQRSWFWSMDKLGVPAEGKGAIRGMSRLYEVKGSAGVAGFIKENRLPYIQKTVPASWLQQVETAAANKIMGQAREKLMRQWRAAVGAGKKASLDNRSLADWFHRRAA